MSPHMRKMHQGSIETDCTCESAIKGKKWDWCVPSVNALIAPEKKLLAVYNPYLLVCCIIVLV